MYKCTDNLLKKALSAQKGYFLFRSNVKFFATLMSIFIPSFVLSIRVGVIKIVIVINCNLITFSKVIACNCN